MPTCAPDSQPAGRYAAHRTILTQHWQQFFFCFLLPPFLELLQAARLEMTEARPSSPEGTAV